MLKPLKAIPSKIRELNTFKKITLAFLLVIIIPMSMSSYFSMATTDEIIVGQVCSDSQASLQLVSKSIDQLLDRMLAAAMEIDYDAMIKSMLGNEAAGGETSERADILKRFEIQNRFDNFMENIIYNTIGVRTYVTIVTRTGKRFTNYNSWGDSQEAYFSTFTADYIDNFVNSAQWTGFEKNYIYGEAAESPHVITLKKILKGNYSNEKPGILVLSIPESELRNLMKGKNSDVFRVLLDKDKRVISSTDKTLIGKEYGFAIPPEAPYKREGYMVEKQKNIVAYSTLKKNDWLLIETKSYSAITDKLNDVRTQMLLVSLIFILVFLITALFLARGIAMPIRRLSKRMLSFGQKEEVYKKSQYRGDEVKILENSFEIMKQSIYEMLEENRNKEKMKREAELAALQAQVSPHFLFNTLNTIRCAAVNGNNEKAADMVLSLSQLLRMTLVRGEELITLSEETELLKCYVSIMQMRHFKSFEVIYEIEEAFQLYKVPKLLLQPLIENAIIHGFDELETGGMIEVSAFGEGERLKITIRDNGKGMESCNFLGDLGDRRNNGFKFTGIGIANVNERIKLYYGDSYGLNVDSRIGKGTLIVIALPRRNI